MDIHNSYATKPPLGLSTKAIKEFQQIYLSEYNLPINEAEASEMGMRFLKLMKMIYKPILKTCGGIKNGS